MNIQAGVNQLLTLAVGASYLGNRAATENLDVAKKAYQEEVAKKESRIAAHQEKLGEALEGLPEDAKEYYGKKHDVTEFGRSKLQDFALEKKGGIIGKRKLAKELLHEKVGFTADSDFSDIEHYKQLGKQQVKQAQDFENFKNSLKEAGVHPDYINKNPETIKKKYEEFKKDGGNI